MTEGNVRSARAAGLPAGAGRGLASRRCGAELARRAGWLRGRGRGRLRAPRHGDLHLGNLCLWQGRPVPFDALEFDEAIATIDLAYDLAFLLMDLDHRAGRAGRQPGAEPLRRAHRRLRRWSPACRCSCRSARWCAPMSRRRAAAAREARAYLAMQPRLSAPAAAGRGRDRRAAGHRQVHAGARAGARTRPPRRARWCCAATRSASATTASRPSSACPPTPIPRPRAARVRRTAPRRRRDVAAAGHAVIADATFSTRRTAAPSPRAAGAVRVPRRLAGGAAGGAGGADRGAAGRCLRRHRRGAARAPRSRRRGRPTGSRSMRPTRARALRHGARCSRRAMRVLDVLINAITSGGDQPWPSASCCCR